MKKNKREKNWSWDMKGTGRRWKEEEFGDRGGENTTRGREEQFWEREREGLIWD